MSRARRQRRYRRRRFARRLDAQLTDIERITRPDFIGRRITEFYMRRTFQKFDGVLFNQWFRRYMESL